MECFEPSLVVGHSVGFESFGMADTVLIVAFSFMFVLTSLESLVAGFRLTELDSANGGLWHNCRMNGTCPIPAFECSCRGKASRMFIENLVTRTIRLASTFHRIPTMVKHGNNPSGKSNAHQQHNLKNAASHAPASLERWYKKITAPKEKNYIVHGLRGKKQPKERTRRVGRDPTKVELKRIRDLERAKGYYLLNPHKWENKQMAMEDCNIV